MEYQQPQGAMLDPPHLGNGDRGTLTPPPPEQQVIGLYGLPGSGKSSITKVVFQKMSPHETLFLPPTLKVESQVVCQNQLCQFVICDVPRSLALGPQDPVHQLHAMVLVMDAEEAPYNEACDFFREVVVQGLAIKPDMVLELFIHKTDRAAWAQEEVRVSLQRDVRAKFLAVLRPHLGREVYNDLELRLTVSCTTVYDHSVFESLSDVVQRLLPCNGTLENMLNSFVTKCRLEKVFLFDMVSKVVLASDSKGVDCAWYELCCDMMDVVIDISCIYRQNGNSKDKAVKDARNSTEDMGCTISLQPTGMSLYYRDVGHDLAVVCMLHQENFDKPHILELNINRLAQALEAVPFYIHQKS